MSISLHFNFAVIAAAALVASGSNTTNSTVPAPAPAPAPTNSSTTGDADCPCKATPTANQVKVAEKPDFVDGTKYGYGCKKHDFPTTYTQPPSPTTENDCTNATYRGTTAGDWCNDMWCIVDSKTCKYNTREVTFTSDPNDMFSYRTCEGSTFLGNGWVGRVACAHQSDSFCTDSFNTALMGSAGCLCKTPAKVQAKVAGEPDFVDGITYGYYCKKHDHPSTYNNEPASPTEANACIAATDKAEGEPKDWCNDKWCIVDEASCDLKTRAVTFTADTTDFFSYATCDPEFAGNGWVGRTKCASNAKSFCSDSENGGTTTSDAPAGASLVLTIVLGICSLLVL